MRKGNNLTLERRVCENGSRCLREEILKSMNQEMNQVVLMPFLYLCATFSFASSALLPSSPGGLAYKSEKWYVKERFV
jgi:hypothetical protein